MDEARQNDGLKPGFHAAQIYILDLRGFQLQSRWVGGWEALVDSKFNIFIKIVNFSNIILSKISRVTIP